MPRPHAWLGLHWKLSPFLNARVHWKCPPLLWPWIVPTYSAKVQYAQAANSSPAATNEEGKYIQKVILHILLYYRRAIDSNILVALSSLAASQAQPTEYTLSLVKWILDYATTNPDANLTYEKSNMLLAIHSDASSLANPQ
jgi:hypothetical protein